ncbi:MAG: rhomboid family intramembrane serine protease [Candidatus Auribacterota bacterium]|jgi:membrane associated rhomboid family serine protease|nr:rhomboid family intramembrane serine protease [Candidatus Auribacterota bacterium]
MDYFEMERKRYTQSGGGALGIGGSVTPVIKYLLLINLSVFLVQALSKLFLGTDFLPKIFGFVPYRFVNYLMIWQAVTYMFLHGGIFHLFWNMLALWMFGGEVEATMGSKNFLKYYFACGIFAGLCSLIFAYNSPIPVIGASGAIYGVLTAFGMLFPERVITLLLFFVLPIRAKAKYFVMAFAALTFLQTLTNTNSGVAHFAHLGGIIFGFLYFRNFFGLQTFVEQISFSKPLKKRSETRDIPRDVYISEEIDPILEKISREGLHSLTKKERKLLQNAKEKL